MKDVKLYSRTIGFLKPYFGLFVLSVLLSLVIVVLDGISLWFLGTLPKALFQPTQIAIERPELSLQHLESINQFFKYQTSRLMSSMGGMNALSAICILITLTYLFKNVIVYTNKMLTVYINIHVVRKMRDSLFRHIIRLPVSFFDKTRSGRLIAYILNDLGVVNGALMGTLSTLAIDPLRLLIFVGLLFVINFKLTLMVFIMYPLMAFIIIAVGRVVRRRNKRVLEKFSGMLSALTDILINVRAVKMFNTNDAEAAHFAQDNYRLSSSQIRTEQARAIISPFTESLGVCVSAVLLWYGGSQAIHGAAGFSAEDFFRFLFICISSWSPIKSLGNINAQLQTGISAAERVFTVFDEREEALLTPEECILPPFEKAITFDRVTFSYPGTSRNVLSGIQMKVEKGKIAAFVGSSGAGKSTLLDLLPRFYDVTGGRILLDDKDVREIEAASLRNLFGIVSQETILFNDSIRANIAYGREKSSLEEITAAAQAANALEFIEKLPAGMNTMIGERGTVLSGGQQQRLAIARALLRNPPILILDEATSSLDTESERLVQDAIGTLMANRTVFVVAHRLSTVQHADCIYVLEGGIIIEHGRHDELLAKDGRYRQLYDIQFSPDRPQPAAG